MKLKAANKEPSITSDLKNETTIVSWKKELDKTGVPQHPKCSICKPNCSMLGGRPVSSRTADNCLQL